MWTPKPPKPKNPGEKPKYDIGDRVKVWRILLQPTGKVQDIIYDSVKPPKYVVWYEYFDGRYFTEEFEAGDLTLVERYNKNVCSCGSNSSRHSDWCNKKVFPNGW